MFGMRISYACYKMGEAMEKLTQEEAVKLLNMLKHTLTDEIDFPEKGNSTEFTVAGDTKKDLFTIRIYRGKINHQKYELSARISKNSIMLLEPHVNPGKPHMNPNGEKLIGSHWHIYSEEYGRKMAFPAEDLQSDLFVQNTIMFLDKFKVIEKPQIIYQFEFV